MEKKIVIALAITLLLGLGYVGYRYMQPIDQTTVSVSSYEGLAEVKSLKSVSHIRGGDYQVIVLQPEGLDEEFKLVFPFALDRYENDIITFELGFHKQQEVGNKVGRDIVYIKISDYGNSLDKFEYIETIK